MTEAPAMGLDDHDLEVTLFQPFHDFDCPPERLRTRPLNWVERAFDIMQELGAEPTHFGRGLRSAEASTALQACA